MTHCWLNMVVVAVLLVAGAQIAVAAPPNLPPGATPAAIPSATAAPAANAASAPASASTSSTANGPRIDTKRYESVFEKTMKAIFTALRTSSDNISQGLLGLGNKLFGVLAVIVLAWSGIKLTLEVGSFSDIVGELFHSLFIIGLTYWFLGAGYGTLTGGIDSFTNDATAVIFAAGPSGSTYDSSNPFSAVGAGFEKIYSVTAYLFDGMTALYKDKNNALTVLEAIFSNILSVVFFGIAMLAIMVVAAIYVLMATAGLILTQVAIAIGPIMIPWLIFSPASFLFEGWLKVMIGSCFYKIVGAVFVALVSNMFTNLVLAINNDFAITKSQLGSISDYLLISTMVISIAILAGYLMWQTPSIVSGLVGGGGIRVPGARTAAKVRDRALAHAQTMGSEFKDSVNAAGEKAASAMSTAANKMMNKNGNNTPSPNLGISPSAASSAASNTGKSGGNTSIDLGVTKSSGPHPGNLGIKL